MDHGVGLCLSEAREEVVIESSWPLYFASDVVGEVDCKEWENNDTGNGKHNSNYLTGYRDGDMLHPTVTRFMADHHKASSRN